MHLRTSDQLGLDPLEFLLFQSDELVYFRKSSILFLLHLLGGLVALGEQSFDPRPIPLDVFLEGRHCTGFPCVAGWWFRRCHGRRTEFLEFPSERLAVGLRLPRNFHFRLQPLLQILLGAGKFSFAFPGGGFDFAPRFRAERLQQRSCLLPAAFGGTKSALRFYA